MASAFSRRELSMCSSSMDTWPTMPVCFQCMFLWVTCDCVAVFRIDWDFAASSLTGFDLKLYLEISSRASVSVCSWMNCQWANCCYFRNGDAVLRSETRCSYPCQYVIFDGLPFNVNANTGSTQTTLLCRQDGWKLMWSLVTWRCLKSINLMVDLP